MASRVVVIDNQSGSQHDYTISAEPPNITGPASALPCVISDTKVPLGAQVEFVIDQPAPFYAYSLRTSGPPEHGVHVTVRSKKPVQTGRVNSDGSLTNGSSVEYVVYEGTPDIRTSSLSPQGMAKSFEIRTGNDFTIRDAIEGTFYLTVYLDRTWTNRMGFSKSRTLRHWVWQQG